MECRPSNSSWGPYIVLGHHDFFHDERICTFFRLCESLQQDQDKHQHKELLRVELGQANRHMDAQRQLTGNPGILAESTLYSLRLVVRRATSTLS